MGGFDSKGLGNHEFVTLMTGVMLLLHCSLINLLHFLPCLSTLCLCDLQRHTFPQQRSFLSIETQSQCI